MKVKKQTVSGIIQVVSKRDRSAATVCRVGHYYIVQRDLHYYVHQVSPRGHALLSCKTIGRVVAEVFSGADIPERQSILHNYLTPFQPPYFTLVIVNAFSVSFSH